MMVRAQITMEAEMQRRAGRRAEEMGISLAEYVRRLIGRDLGAVRKPADVSAVFDLGDSGSSGGSDVAADKDAMIAEAFQRSHEPRPE